MSQSVQSYENSESSSGPQLGLEERFADDSHPCPEDFAQKSLLRDDLLRVLNELPPLERDVVALRFGLEDGQPKTYEVSTPPRPRMVGRTLHGSQQPRD